MSADPKPAGWNRRAVIRALRGPIDFLMLLGACLSMAFASGSFFAGIAASTAVAAYGLFCYFDGSMTTTPHAD